MTDARAWKPEDYSAYDLLPETTANEAAAGLLKAMLTLSQASLGTFETLAIIEQWQTTLGGGATDATQPAQALEPLHPSKDE
jgi:hypothetical protein